MLRALGTLAATAFLTTAGPIRPAPIVAGVTRTADAPLDVATLLAAAHGAPPAICALAARSVGNGFGSGLAAPVTPLGPVMRDDDVDVERLPSADVERLLTGLASDDACVREISVRLLGRQRDSSVATALVSRLGSSDASMRAVAAFGLGLEHQRSAVPALIRTLRDPSADVRANAAWALGLLRDRNAVSALMPLFQDASPVVREAAVAATGHLDPGPAVAALVRTLQHDDSPEVRRVAAWALGQREVSDPTATNALATAATHDGDARVREMAAWAIGNTESTGGAGALRTALRGDSDDRVRETAAWALAELHDESAADALAAAASSDRNARVRSTAAWGLGELGAHSPAATSALLRVLQDGDSHARFMAAWALGQIGDSGAIPGIQAALKREQNPEVRMTLVRALTHSGGSSPEALSGLLESGDARVREAAVRALAGRRAIDPMPMPQPRPRPFP